MLPWYRLPTHTHTHTFEGQKTTKSPWSCQWCLIEANAMRKLWCTFGRVSVEGRCVCGIPGLPLGVPYSCSPCTSLWHPVQRQDRCYIYLGHTRTPTNTVWIHTHMHGTHEENGKTNVLALMGCGVDQPRLWGWPAAPGRCWRTARPESSASPPQ